MERDVMKLMRNLIEADPVLKKLIEDDDRYRDERLKHHLSNGYSKEDANLKAWDDYWRMANERDGVEFSIHELSK